MMAATNTAWAESGRLIRQIVLNKVRHLTLKVTASVEENPWFQVLRDMAVSRFGPPLQAPARAPNSFAFSQVDYVIDILNDAGFKDSLSEVVRIALVFPGTAMEAAFIAVKVAPATGTATYYSTGPDDTLWR